MVFEYHHPYDTYVAILGDVRKLPTDTYLIGWSTSGMIEEVTANQEVTWRLESAIGGAFGRVAFIPDLYEAYTD